MTDLLGFGAFGASNPVTTRPAITPGNGVGDPDTWARDCSTPAAADGTEVAAAWGNALLAQIRAIIRKSGVTLDNTDDNMLARGVRSHRLNWLTAGGTANAITLTPDPAFGALADLVGVPLRFLATAATTGAVTLSVNGLTAKNVVARGASQIGRGAINTGDLVEVMYDGTNFVFSPVSVTGGRYLGEQVFTANGTYTPTPGTSLIRVRAVGGGGGGSGTANPGAGLVSLGAPGTAGTYAEARFTATQVGASQTVTIGAGGAGGVGVAGDDGSSTSLGSLLVVPGGEGGGPLNAQTAPAANGNGTTSLAATGATFSRSGTAPAPSVAFSATSGIGAAGGDSPLGAGGYTISANTTGASAVGYGGGGGGTMTTSGSGSTGGAGFAGFMIIEEYAL